VDRRGLGAEVLIHLGVRGELRGRQRRHLIGGSGNHAGPSGRPRPRWPALTAEPMPCSVKATDPMVSVRRITTMLFAE
jgi:hypothetical protein